MTSTNSRLLLFWVLSSSLVSFHGINPANGITCGDLLPQINKWKSSFMVHGQIIMLAYTRTLCPIKPIVLANVYSVLVLFISQKGQITMRASNYYWQDLHSWLSVDPNVWLDRRRKWKKNFAWSVISTCCAFPIQKWPHFWQKLRFCIWFKYE